MSLLELFCHVDDFWLLFGPWWREQLLTHHLIRRQRKTNLYESEIMTIMILFHQSGYRDFKTFYIGYVQRHLKPEFPRLVSYNRFVRLLPRVGIPLYMYLRTCMGHCTGISFVDATSLAVCHNRRIYRHKVFTSLAARGKTTMGWFFGFKLHLVVNDRGELLAFAPTPGNVDDRQPLPSLVKTLFGKLYADKGYLSQPLVESLLTQGLHLVTGIRSNMKPRLMEVFDKLMLRKRAIIETIHDQLKNISQIEHSRHRSVNNFFVNVLAGLIAYCHRPNKPASNWSGQQRDLLPLAA
jgi:hypothetical protein